MSIQDPFAIGTPPWLQTDGSDPDHSGDYVRLGRTNVLGDAKKSSDMDPDHIKATFVVNSAPGNATFAAKNLANQGSASLAFGLFGDSDGSVASAGVLGSSACWRVAGLSTSNDIDSDTPFPKPTGVLGVGDFCGVYGQSTPSNVQDPPNLAGNLFGTQGSGVVGVGDKSGVFGIGIEVGVQGKNTGTKVGVLGSSASGIGVLVAANALKQLQPPHYKTNPTFPDLPRNGKAGDLLVVTINETPKDTRGVQLWLCIKSDDTKLAQNATWARVQLENELTVP